ncbi:hypothetical protein Zmor_009291 [Zophobas morio]|uniref:Luciferin 4-monooxygenase n=1 Tax=Zophobas morio TaxID=2755281 RepID=A0AA38IIU0_9CUCU|nr:hypothetical protein Zmor_009291 [Zophobas morio]
MSFIRTVFSTALKKSAKSLSTPRFHRKLSNLPPNVLYSDLPDVSIPKLSTPEFIFEKCTRYEHLTAVECGLTGRKYTYGDLLKKSMNLSRHLRKNLGFKEGDVVAILLPNIPEYPLVVLGVQHAGLVVTTLNPVYTPEEIHRQLEDSSAKGIITLVSSWQTASSSCRLLNKSLPILVIRTEQSQSLPRGAIDFHAFLNTEIDYPDPPPCRPHDLAILPYSSGTTGLPKGVQLTHRNLVANLCQTQTLNFVEDTTSGHQDVVPAVLPMFHVYGCSVNSLLVLTKGAKIVTLPKFTPEDYVSVLRTHKPHVLFLVPPIVLFLSGHPMVKQQNLQSVRIVVSGAAPLGASDEHRFIEKVGRSVHMVQGYGLTEATAVAVATIKLKEEVNVQGSIGRPAVNTLVKVVAIDDPSGTPLGVNATGELLVKGPQVMKGYHNKAEETKNAFLDGWFRTGDIAYYNEDRVLFITDRLKELIKVKGFQVPPAELEEIIRDFPNVEDAAVIGVPHPDQGEAPRAYVVPKKGTRVNQEELQEYVKTKAAHYKQLKGGVAIVDSIPKTASGKILRRSLKLEYEANLTTGK